MKLNDIGTQQTVYKFSHPFAKRKECMLDFCLPLTPAVHCLTHVFLRHQESGGGQGGGNPGEYGREVAGRREETERDAGVM